METIRLDKIIIEVPVYEPEIKTYGKEGLKLLFENLVQRYFTEEYYDPGIVEEILENRKDHD